MASKRKSDDSSDRIVYREFGNQTTPEALERGVPDLPPQQQNLRVERSRAGRKGKTVTIIRGFQANAQTLADLLKQLKGHCGAGGTVKDDTIELQGDHRDKVVAWLVKQGYKAKPSGG